jgi:hypothetical protein
MRSFIIFLISSLLVAMTAFAQDFTPQVLQGLRSTKIYFEKSPSDSRAASHLNKFKLKKELVASHGRLWPELKKSNLIWEPGDFAFTDSATGVWRYNRSSNDFTRLADVSAEIKLGDIEIDPQGNLFFLDKGLPRQRSGDIYILTNDNTLYHLFEPTSELAFNPFGIDVSGDGFIYGSGWVSSELGGSSIFWYYDLNLEVWGLTLCVFNLDVLRTGTHPTDVFSFPDELLFTDQTPDGIYSRGPGAFFVEKINECINENNYSIFYNGNPFTEPISLMFINLINPVNAIIVADNAILTQAGNHRPGFVALNLQASVNGRRRIDDFYLGEPFARITDLASDVLPFAFFITDAGKRKIFWVRQIAQSRFNILEAVDLRPGSPQGIAVYTGQSRNIPKAISTQLAPRQFALAQNFPNPFNPKTVIGYTVGKTTHVSLKIYDMLGQEVKTLANDIKTPGEYEGVWDGHSDLGAEVSSGLYIYQMISDDDVETRKMLLLR